MIQYFNQLRNDFYLWRQRMLCRSDWHWPNGHRHSWCWNPVQHPWGHS